MYVQKKMSTELMTITHHKLEESIGPKAMMEE